MFSTKDKIEHHLSNYEKVKSSFLWENVAKELSGLPEGKGLNIGHEAIDKHTLTNQKNSIALRFIRKDSNFKDFTYFKDYQ